MYDCPLGDGFSCSAASKVRGDEMPLLVACLRGEARVWVAGIRLKIEVRDRYRVSRSTTVGMLN
jgi:hypothetical protein